MNRILTVVLSSSGLLVCLACSRKAPQVQNAGPGNGDTKAAEATEGHEKEPLQLVKEYLERDSRGERLGSAPWFRTVVTWPDDPGYDSYTVIQGFEFTPLSSNADTVRVRVVYHTAGWITAGDSTRARFTPHDTLEAHVFTVVRRQQGWLIAAPQIDQHVTADAALRTSHLGARDREALQPLLRPSGAKQSKGP